MSANQKISCSFSLFNEGRTYTGNHRKYLVKNAREVCYSPAVREKIRLREALGFYGHGRRVLAGRMNLGEVEAVTLPDGSSAIVSNIPSNVTVAFDVGEDGTVTHTQEILNTETGRIVAGLHGSRVGGFSWACPGSDGGKSGVTRLSSFAGFDYVLNPGFAHNRGYVLEAASARADAVLESVSSVLQDKALAQKYVKAWMLDDTRAASLEEELFVLEAENAERVAECAALKKAILESASQRDMALQEKETIEQNMLGALAILRDALPVFLPESATKAILAGDLDRARAIFESAARIDFSQYPVGRGAWEKPAPAMPPTRREPEFGTAEYGDGMFREKKYVF